jgi:hypothetical protein
MHDHLFEVLDEKGDQFVLAWLMKMERIGIAFAAVDAIGN